MGTEAYARNTDLPTSHQAAASVRPTEMEVKVYECLIREFPTGMTASEIAEALGIGRDSVTPRIKPLRKKGLVVEHGDRVGPSGRAQTVWRAVPQNLPFVW